MERINSKVIAIATWAVAWSTAQAAAFVNLDFESADLSGSRIENRHFTNTPIIGDYPFGEGPTEQLLPGWQVIVGGQQTNISAISNGFLDSALWGEPIPSFGGLLVPGLFIRNTLIAQPAGRYALILHADWGSPDVTVSQTAEVPANAKWLTFRPMTREWIGVVVHTNSFVPKSRFIDISEWAGKIVTIGFCTGPSNATLVVDDVRFLARDELEPIRLKVTKSDAGVTIS